MFLIRCQSLTSSSTDIELLAIYRKQQEDFSKMLAGIPHLIAKYTKQSSTNSDGNERCDSKCKQKLLNQIFLQSSSSQTYATDAYRLFKPVIGQAILYHTVAIQ